LLCGGNVALKENDAARPDFFEKGAQFRATLQALESDTQQLTRFFD